MIVVYYIVAIFSIITLSFIIPSAYFYFRFRQQGMKPIKSELGKYKERNLLWRLFVEFPRQLALDRLTFDPNTFREYGMHLLCGEQGSGKTTLMAYMIRKYRYIYPRLRILSNFDCALQNESLHSWEQLTLDTNGIYGELDCIDEIQNWFSSNQSKDFPPDMLTLITQQRKVRRCILATSQVFTRVAKPIRENTYLMYYPITIAGALTFVRVYKPVLDDAGTLKERKLRKVFFFVHDAELREMFDSYKTICSLRSSGFKPATEHMVNSDSFITVEQPPEKKKKK